MSRTIANTARFCSNVHMPGSHPAPPSTAPLTLGPADTLRVLAEHVDAEPDRAERAAIATHLRALADTLPVHR